LNRSGFTVMMDTMLFLTIIVLALTVSAHIVQDDHGYGKDPDEFLSDLSEMEVRLSDFTDIEDDSLVFFTDVLAYTVVNGSDAERYLRDVLDSIYGDSSYGMELEFQGKSIFLGQKRHFFSDMSSRQYSVSIGGSLYIRLSLR